MNMDITGRYTINIPVTTMFLNTTFTISGENLITFFGESFFMNRCINDNFEPIKYIVLGNASLNPKKEDLKLGNETNRKICVCQADLINKCLVLTSTFKADQIIGTSEIGVCNDRILISHDRYPKIDESFLGVTSEVKVEYVFQFTTGALKGGWNNSNMSNVFYAYEPNNVVGVFEKNSDSWYYKVDSLNDLSGLRGAYFYDDVSKNLYIRPKRDLSLDDLSDEEIIVQVK